MIPAVLAGTGLVLAYSYLSGPKNTIAVKSTVDKKIYQVQNLPDKQEAADFLARIRAKLIKIVSEFKADVNTREDPPYERLIAKFNPDVFQENDLDAPSTSYSENKGERIVVCLRDKIRPPYPFVSENTVMFVLLHEMAHLMTDSIGHTPEFWTNFRKILQDCMKNGEYTPTNYNQSPTEYCGMTISDTPL
jgi:hypothetical protein